jgi:hypothetical protein
MAALAMLTTVGCGGGGGGGGGAAGQPAATGATEVPTNAGTAAGAGAAVETSGGDPCRMLTAAEAQSVLGEAVLAPVTHDLSDPVSGHGFACSYSSANANRVSANLLGDKVPRAEWEQAERQEDLQEVAGVGELAFFDGHNEEIVVFDHGRAIQVGLANGTTGSELLAILTGLARKALERI